MNKKLHNFLNSGLLDKYLIGDTTAAENATVEAFIDNYPEVKEEYDLMQDQLELTARAQAKSPSKDVLGNIMDTLEGSKVISLKTNKKRFPYWLSVAACVAALVFAGTSYVFYNQNRNLVDENNTIADEVFDLRGDIEQNNKMLDEVMRKLIKLDNPETQKYLIKGNDRSEDLKAVAYINPIEKSSLIDVVELPELSDEECYQMWAQLSDRMINLGILDKADRNLKSLPYIEDALSLKITIEPKGGNENASLDNEVAEIPLKKNDQ